MPEGVGARLFLLSARSGDALAALAERTTQTLSNEAAGAVAGLLAHGVPEDVSAELTRLIDAYTSRRH